MKLRDTERLHPVIDRELARLSRSAPATSAWHEAWSRLSPQSTGEERLKVCQAVRDAGIVPEDAGHFLVSWATENFADDELARLSDPMTMLNTFEYCRAHDRIRGELLERCGEARLAALLRTNPEEQDRRREAGRLFFFGPNDDEEKQADAPGWLDRLLRAVAASVVASRPVESLGYRYCPDPFVRQLHVRPRAGTGRSGETGWAFDVEKLREYFEKINGCAWYAAPADADGVPYLWVEGTFGDREVFLRILPDAADAAGEGKGWGVWTKPG